MLAMWLNLTRPSRWTRPFPTWFAPFLACFRHQSQSLWAQHDVRGLTTLQNAQ